MKFPNDTFAVRHFFLCLNEINCLLSVNNTQRAEEIAINSKDKIKTASEIVYDQEPILAV